jgi:hypothetical protein
MILYSRSGAMGNWFDKKSFLTINVETVAECSV